MLRIQSLKLYNFGPYYGENYLQIPDREGVTIIWGENGYGKTTIMNAFRYVLWGKIYDRKRRTLPAHTFVNTNALSEHGNMYVELHMVYDDDSFIITRGLKRKSGDGRTEEDYTPSLQIKRNGQIIAPNERESLLESILPDRISRFYLFDGELLSEYEDLLDETDESGSKIKRSIEDILGLPVLEESRDNLSAILGGLNRNVSDITSADERTAKLSEQLLKSQNQIEILRDSKSKLLNDSITYENEKEDIIRDMRNNSIYSRLLAQQKTFEDQIKKDSDKCDELKEHIQNLADESWRYIMNDVISSIISDITPKIKALSHKIGDIDSNKAIIDFIERSLSNDNDNCPICNQRITAELKYHIINQLRNRETTGPIDQEREMLHKLESNKVFLENCKVEKNTDLLIKYLQDIEDYQADKDIIQNKLNNLQSELSEAGRTISEEEIKNLPHKLEKIQNKIESNKLATQVNQEQIDTTVAAIKKISENIERNTKSKEARKVFSLRDYTQKIVSLFEKSIDLFRDELKENVEKDASDLFVAISHDESYCSLKINDNYGLKIIGTDGLEVPNRSSGYEQVVAISLISALHKNAPIDGPIFMDSTFQRVDDVHKSNILKSLPQFGSQIIVLAYGGEIGDKNKVREILGDHLLAEYNLQHDTSTKTRIED
ncbi:MAG: AAA family ATPase [Prevotella sp.]|nr:AAA family ATPase [Prevotella sp.]